ncbi:MAG: 50S ribosomal protein L11 methyltransferase [Leptospiraceae bacterium]|nr:50S ribosomal protein L11 methyltransferase [Leptospiraceae bacterium]
MSSSYHEIELRLSKDAAQELSALLDQNAIQDLSGYYEVLYDETRPSEEQATLMLYFPLDCRDGRWDLEALLLASGVDRYEITERTIHQEDYQENYKQHYRPFVVGDSFAIVPSWYKDTEDDARFEKRNRIYLDPGLAFGTGLHATSRMMIRWIEKQDLSNTKIMDAGCGSGILTIAAMRRNAGPLLAFDIDGNAVHATRSNLALNFEPDDLAAVTVLKGGWDLPAIAEYQPEITLANITLNVFRQAREQVSNLPSRILVVSGIIEEQKEEFLSEFPMWQLESEMEDDGWLVMEFSRKRD